LEEKPVLTKCVTSGFLSFTADFICQTNEQYAKKKGMVFSFKYDVYRLLRFTFLGTALVGPILHSWYGLLVKKLPGNSMLATIQRLALDQLVFAPVFLPTFFACNLILEGRPENIIKKIETDWFSTVVANWSLWVPSQFINFKFIPPQFQVLFSNSVGLLWNIYLSSITYKTQAMSTDEPTEEER
jgi:hypothetical protein